LTDIFCLNFQSKARRLIEEEQQAYYESQQVAAEHEEVENIDFQVGVNDEEQQQQGPDVEDINLGDSPAQLSSSSGSELEEVHFQTNHVIYVVLFKGTFLLTAIP